MTEPGPEGSPAEPAGVPVEPAGASSAEPPPTRRGLIGPFTGRQLLAVLLVVVVGAVALALVTRPIAPGPGTAIATTLPVSTPYVVGSPTVGLQPGQQAPELTWTGPDGAPASLMDLDGTPVRLSDLRGKVVWLNFWATWCPPCQGETPVLRTMAERYGDRLAIVGIAVQETTPDDVRAYAERYELPYTIAFDASADAFDLYRVFALPTQIIIGTDGRITNVVNGPLTVESAERLLGLTPETPGPS